MNTQQENSIEKPKNKGGRPTNKELWKKNIGYGVTKLTQEAVNKFGEAFAIGATRAQACEYADVSPQTYYNWCAKNPELLEYFDKMRQKLPLKAKHNIAQAIHSGNLTFSQWLVERKESGDYGETLKLEHSGEVKDGDDTEIVLQFREKLKQRMLERSKNKAKQDGER